MNDADIKTYLFIYVLDWIEPGTLASDTDVATMLLDPHTELCKFKIRWIR